MTCERDADGFAVRFDDFAPGADTYEVTINFAQALAADQTSSTHGTDLSFRFAAKIDGSDEVWLSSSAFEWKHTGWSMPQDVTVNGQSWDLTRTTKVPPAQPFSPESVDFQRATLQKSRGRGAMNLDYLPERLSLDFEHYDASVENDFKTSSERLCLAFDDPADGADWYEGTVIIPRFRARYLVRLTARPVNGILGTPLKVYRFPAGSEAQTVLAGQRFFGPDGDCVAALEPGRYEFEALRQDSSGSLVALRTGAITISGPTNIDFQPRQWEPNFIGPNEMPITINDLAIRSVRPGGAITWQRQPGQSSNVPSVTLSRGVSYHRHIFGHAQTNYVAVWTAVTATNAAPIKIANKEWLEASFSWLRGTPQTIQRGVVLDFPDGKLEIPDAGRCSLLTNRRFFTVAYWLGFPDGRRAAFEPHPCLLTGGAKLAITLGGTLHPLASAAVLQDEALGRPDALRLWSDITLGDAEGYLLDTTRSTVAWASKVKMKDGTALPPAPLPPDFVKRLGNVKDHLIAGASYRMDAPRDCAVAPEPLADVRRGRFSMKAPPYRPWNTTSYLAKADRELSFTFLIRGVPNQPQARLDIKWWLNGGAVGGGNSITMPIIEYLQSLDWYGHPWALAHETLHNFGFGHTHEMNRVDAAVQEQMDFFRWSVADNPGYVPMEYFRR